MFELDDSGTSQNGGHVERRENPTAVASRSFDQKPTGIFVDGRVEGDYSPIHQSSECNVIEGL